MTAPVFEPDGPDADRVEISNGIQTEPSRTVGQFGTTLDYANVGRMMFCVEVVDVQGSRLVAYFGTSYEQAIVDAEESARDWGVTVHDNVTPGPGA